ncbi:hypothetical protein DFH06DRAFT_1215353 [Mycena polygramma]|nr:hypothetical protein DFH06DRAFT_1215353 [Mycena polygramma]
MSNMSLEEAEYHFRPRADILRRLYPTLPSHQHMQAWIADHKESFREAAAMYIAAHHEDFPPGTTVDPSGSIFGHGYMDGCHYDPLRIVHKHQGFTYTVTDPVHVAALHAFRDPDARAATDSQQIPEKWDRPVYVAALAYILANYDSRVPWKPRVITVPDGWHPGVWRFCMHPEEQALHSPPGAQGSDRVSEIPAELHDPVRFPLMSDVRAAAKAAGKHEQTRYTVFGWRKIKEMDEDCDIFAKQRYLFEHFDLKQVLDEEKRVLSSEWAPDYQIETEKPRL